MNTAGLEMDIGVQAEGDIREVKEIDKRLESVQISTIEVTEGPKWVNTLEVTEYVDMTATMGQDLHEYGIMEIFYAAEQVWAIREGLAEKIADFYEVPWKPWWASKPDWNGICTTLYQRVSLPNKKEWKLMRPDIGWNGAELADLLAASEQIWAIINGLTDTVKEKT